jgi:hypothetical protein
VDSAPVAEAAVIADPGVPVVADIAEDPEVLFGDREIRVDAIVVRSLGMGCVAGAVRVFRCSVAAIGWVVRRGDGCSRDACRAGRRERAVPGLAVDSGLAADSERADAVGCTRVAGEVPARVEPVVGALPSGDAFLPSGEGVLPSADRPAPGPALAGESAAEDGKAPEEEPPGLAGKGAAAVRPPDAAAGEDWVGWCNAV